MAEESAVAPRGLNMGGLGGFETTKDFIEAVQEADAPKHGTATAEDIKDGMGSIPPSLERLRVKHGGACCLQFEDGTKVDELAGVVVAYTYHNSYFDKAFEEREEGELPACFSHNSVDVSDRSEDPQGQAGCATCPRNRAATSSEARDHAFKLPRNEACNNYLSLAIALPGNEAPVHLRLSQASFKPWAAYIQRIGTHGRFKMSEVATRFTLRNQTGPGGSEYTVVGFELIQPLPADLAAQMTAATKDYCALLQRRAGDDEGGDNREAAEAVAAARAAQNAAQQEGAAL